MKDPIPESGLSPLDQIRQAEAEMNRAVAAARQAGEQIIAEAKQRAAELKRQAQEAGEQEGRAAYRATITEAEAEARAITSEASARALELRSKGLYLLEEGVRHTFEIVIGQPEETN